MDLKVLGSILLIIGTSIGAGMLALPVANTQAGFVDSSLFLFICWIVMASAAFLILEVNLWFPRGSNMVSMARGTLGKFGAAVTWLCYLLLLYTVLCAYISGGSDLLNALLKLSHIDLARWIVSISFVALLGSIVYQGIRSVDLVNRGLMFIKLGTYFLLVIFVAPHVKLDYLKGGEIKYVWGSLMVLISAFGFSTIVPSLRDYFEDDVKKLRLVILAGSLTPLVFYILWDAVIMGVVHQEGTHGLLHALQSGHATSELTSALQAALQNQRITDIARVFTSVCMLTSFLGVSLCLWDFLADGLKLRKFGKQGSLLTLCVFGPPLGLVLFLPNLFIAALKYAGILSVVLLALLPALMTWFGRYQLALAQTGAYRFKGGKLTIALLIVVAAGLTILGTLQTL